jgi:type III secretory pathway lipoprotein EscJ
MRAVLLLLLFASVAQADASSRLSPSPDALHRERTQELEQRLARLLRALPGAEAVTVALSLPAPFAEPLDASPTPARATVVVSGSVRRDDVLRLVLATVPNLAERDVSLLERAPQSPSPATSFVQIGPFRVHPGDAVGLRSWLTISLLANVALAGIVLSRLRRP